MTEIKHSNDKSNYQFHVVRRSLSYKHGPAQLADEKHSQQW